MNIREAKDEVKNTIRAYLAKDETGAYLIPVEKQRSLLLMGAPGIGKTAIMEQAAQEMGINLISYTITHHTRQSAIGLPMIAHRHFGGEEYTVTEYTMSEIIASIYEQIEASGVSEGILFLDEINCVSETLAPTMLQFLQYKTFGSHRVPDGFVIVTAGNPPEYNKSVREFDIVTLDRLRVINISEDVGVWREYARAMGVHGAILAYLSIRPQHFYSIHTEVEGRRFVTARGWEDLSRMLLACEKLEIPVTGSLIGEYLQDPEIARDFSDYYALYQKYRTNYRISDILAGIYPEDVTKIADAPFDEKLSLIGLLMDALSVRFRRFVRDTDVQNLLFGELTSARSDISRELACQEAAHANAGQPATSGHQAGASSGSPAGSASGEVRETVVSLLAARTDALASRCERMKKAKMLSADQEAVERIAIQALWSITGEIRMEGTGDLRADYGMLKRWFAGREDERSRFAGETTAMLTHAFTFLANTYGENQEMVLFLSDLGADRAALRFVREVGNEDYYKYNRLLLLKDRREELAGEIRRTLSL